MGLIWVDFAILGVIAVSVLIGAWRGFVRESISLASWIAALLVAVMLAEKTAGLLSRWISVPSIQLMAAFGGLFLLTLLVGGLVGFLLGQLVDRTGLGGTDHLVGMIFGLLRGAVLVGVLVMLSELTALPEDPWWEQSVLLPHFEDLASWLRDLLPEEYAARLA